MVCTVYGHGDFQFPISPGGRNNDLISPTTNISSHFTFTVQWRHRIASTFAPDSSCCTWAQIGGTLPYFWQGPQVCAG